MSKFRAGCVALLALGAAACANDSESREPVAPDARADAAAAGRFQQDAGDPSAVRHIAIMDDCDPTDAAWAPTGGCLRKAGSVTFAEFSAGNVSSLATSVVGHQAWRIDPTYLEISEGMRVRVRNMGGRVHTFTEVAAFGGGRSPSPVLNRGLVTAPECPRSTDGSTDIPPGGTLDVSPLGVGNHRFQCCIHSWQRALIKVEASGTHGGH